MGLTPLTRFIEVDMAKAATMFGQEPTDRIAPTDTVVLPPIVEKEAMVITVEAC